jgi:hypothetical protein
MQKTLVPLYRMGNASSPRMDHVRSQDVEVYENNGELWVVERSGGISTFSVQGLGKNWWLLAVGTEVPTELFLINDYGNHWSWEPNCTMPIEDYKSALRRIGDNFCKVS